jgi:membrane fusion protein, multidrug efflux system
MSVTRPPVQEAPTETHRPPLTAADQAEPGRPEVLSPPEAPAAPGRRSWVKPAALLAGLVALTVLGVMGYRHFQFAAWHVSTDNATLVSDVVQVSPRVSGAVQQVLVRENQVVKQGDLLVVLEEAPYRAAYEQAKASLDVAIAEARGAVVAVNVTAETGSATQQQAQGALQLAESGIASANADEARAEAGVANSRATAKGAEASIASAQAALNAATASKQRFADAIDAAQAQVETAKAGVRAAQAAEEAAQSVYEKASKDAQRYASLVKEGAVSEQTADSAQSAARQAKAQWESAKQGIASAQAVVTEKQADVRAARQELEWADANIAQARAGLDAAREQCSAARAGIKQAQAVVAASRQGIQAARARREQALGQLSQAHVAPRQVDVSRADEAQAAAKIEQARAVLKAAYIQLHNTRIYAPVGGRVSKKTVDVGATIQAGTPLMAIVPLDNIWVVANFKETQMAAIRPGKKAEIEVDGVPGRTFRGHVDSIAAATGSTFALLPPDNATGNFTKVVQRVPVKIVFEPGQPDMDRLRTGMSVTAVVETK